MNRALRRHRTRVAKIHHDNIYIDAYGWRHWVEPWSWRTRRNGYQYRPMSKLIMTESGHKHWRKVLMTRPDRAREHHALRMVERGIDAECLYWPTHRDHWVYYW